MKDKQYPLLTHDQLVDWLIYHCPLQDSKDRDRPFLVSYRSQYHSLSFNNTSGLPENAYWLMASDIMIYKEVHREITDLYWYWTI